MLASSLREDARATVSNKPGHRGEREVSRKTIARGMPGNFRCDRGDYARVFVFFTHEAAGASSARHSLRPLIFRRRDVLKQASRETCGEIAKPWLQMTLFEIRVYENSWRDCAICCVVTAKAGTHNHRCMWLHSVWPRPFTRLKLVVMGSRFRGGDERG